MNRKILLIVIVVVCGLWVVGCGSSTKHDQTPSSDSDNFRIYGTTGNEDFSAGSSRILKNMMWTEPQGGADEVHMRFYRVWIAEDADCSGIDPHNPITDYRTEPDGYMEFDLVSDTLPIVTTFLPEGTYNCLVFHVGGVLRSRPDEVAQDAFVSCTDEEHLTAICHDDVLDMVDMAGDPAFCNSTNAVPDITDEFYLFLSTDPEGITVDGVPVSRHQTLQLGNGVTVPGNAFLIVNFDDRIMESTSGDPPVTTCQVEEPTIGFSMDPWVESIKSWRQVGETVTDYVPHAIRFAADRNFIVTADIGNNDVTSRWYSKDADPAEWVSISHKDGTTYTAGSIGLTLDSEKALIMWIDQTPAQWQCKIRSQWSTEDIDCSVSGLPSGTLAETTRLQIRLVNDGDHFYLAFGETGAGRPVRVHRLPVADIEDPEAEWEQIGGGSPGNSSVVAYGHEIGVHQGTLFVAFYMQGEGITVKKSVNGATWETVGDPFTLSDNVTAMSLSTRFGNIDLAYVLNAGVHVHRFNTAAAEWQIIGTSDVTGGNAEHLHISSSSLTPYIAFQDALNSNHPTLFQYKNDVWTSVVHSEIEVLHSEIYDFIVFGGVPHILYLDNGATRLKRFDSADF